MQLNEDLVTITEGSTKVIVPRGAMVQKVPPRDLAFFNPRAKLNRDFSILAYSAFFKSDMPKIFLDGMAGLGARGLRVANEIKDTLVFANDVNPNSVELARRSAELNGLKNYHVFQKEICAFLSEFSTKSKRATIVDIDPFGSPAKYIECGLRATIHNGMLSVTATDLQVLHGIFSDACKKKYGGIPIKTTYSNEISLRLILGMIISVAARLDLQAVPIFSETNQHYYRVYVRVLHKSDTRSQIGYIIHCKNCGNRKTTQHQFVKCDICNLPVQVAGPLWIGQLFEKEFVASMIEKLPTHVVDKKCQNTLGKCILESDMSPLYYTLDEIARLLRTSPPSLQKIVEKLKQKCYLASPTSLNPIGFRTNCNIDKIKEFFLN